MHVHAFGYVKNLGSYHLFVNESTTKLPYELFNHTVAKMISINVSSRSDFSNWELHHHGAKTCDIADMLQHRNAQCVSRSTCCANFPQTQNQALTEKNLTILSSHLFITQGWWIREVFTTNEDSCLVLMSVMIRGGKLRLDMAWMLSSTCGVSVSGFNWRFSYCNCLEMKQKLWANINFEVFLFWLPQWQSSKNSQPK